MVNNAFWNQEVCFDVDKNKLVGMKYNKLHNSDMGKQLQEITGN